MSSNKLMGIDKTDGLFYDIAANTKDGIWVSDKEDRIIFFNTAMGAIAGVTADKVIGLKVTSNFSKETTQNFIEYYQKAKTSLKPTEYEAEVVTPSGRITIQQGWCIPRVLNNEYNGIICTIRDITSQKHAEARYVELFNNMPNGVAVYTVVENGNDFVFYDYNKAAEIIDNDKRERLVGKRLRQMRPGVEDFGLLEVFKRVWLSGKPEHHPVKLYKDNALSGWYDNYVYKLPSGEIVAVFENVTDIQQAQETLREGEAKFRKSLEFTPTPIAVAKNNGDMVFLNKHFVDAYGYTLQDLPTIEKWFVLAYPDVEYRNFVLNDWGNRVAVALKDNVATIPYAYLATCKNGEVKTVEVSAFFETDYSIGLFQDITERKKAEEEHLKYEQQLQKSQKLESLGILAGGIAHDFNNLMGGLFGYLDLANEESKDSKVTSYLSKAMNTIDRARALTQQLLTFAKGGSPIQEIGNLFPFVQESAQFALSGANVSCHFDIPKDLWACNFDKNQIGQVIDNLIINAQQAMPVGGSIELTARNITLAEKEHPLLEKGNYVRISVKDSGIGIPKELISKIFDPFFTTKAKGHGLGLATCYSIIKRHGGCIDVESEPGKGSTFKVYLPASTESASSAIKKTDKTHKGSGTFLIMDDEEVMRDTIGDMLENLGYLVVSKENGKDAIEFFSSETQANRKIAGIIFDLTVPGGMGGKAAIEEIRKLNTEIPAFVASGYADDPVMKRPVEHGFTASICKPFRKSELSEMLNKYMQTKK